MRAKETPQMAFNSREKTGTGVCRKLRVAGQIPVVLYGENYKEGLSGAVSLKDIAHIANGAFWETTMIKLSLPEGKEEMALLREVQRHPVSRNIQHIDLYQLVKGHKVRVIVPVRLQNKELCVGVKMGGKLEQILRDVVIETDPQEIPGDIVVDIAKMEMGQEVLMKDMEIPAHAVMVTPGDQPVIMVTRPKSMTDAAEDAEGEVEVVAKGKAKKAEA